MTNILFVCTGNTCRSPMAEALLKYKKKDELHVRSAGVFANQGSEASYQTVQVLNEEGIPNQHRSSLLSEEHVKWATYILTMTTSHKQLINSQYPEAREKTFTLKEFVQEPAGYNLDISDPFGGSVKLYRETFKEMTTLIDALIKKIDKL
ncbi:low molecular weight protein arginine phosphatase [Bacillus timonensis]|nr:low molecular weight protein arginine phosphatase [Bacillus timonensis]